MKNYISRYSKFETHFHRTDPWKYAQFEQTTTSKLMSGLGFIACIICAGFVLMVAAA